MPTKLGPHVLRPATGLSEYIAAGAAVAKFVSDWGMAPKVPEGVFVIGRKVMRDYDAQLQRETGKTPLEAAQQLINDQLPTYQANPTIKYWEGHNEPVWNTAAGMAWYAQFEIERMRLMAKLGLKCVIGNFSTGAPDLPLWQAFLPACREALQYEAILGVHEYSCPWMWWMTGNYQVNPEEDEGDEGWGTLRYRKVYRQWLIPNHVGTLPLVITEAGIDPLVGPNPYEKGTWKQLGDFWREHDNEHDPADYYFRQLVWYDQELQKDDYVIGATIFTWGSFGPPWQHFDVAGTAVGEKLIAYAQSDPARPFKYPQIDVETTRPRGMPRTQYKRRYVLLPPDAGAEWARAVIDATWDDSRYTVGASADDAGIGDLDARRVIAVNPHRWPGTQSLRSFFDVFYPGVEYTGIRATTPEELVEKLARMQDGEATSEATAESATDQQGA